MEEKSIHQKTISDRRQSDVLYSAHNMHNDRGKQTIVFLFGLLIGFGSFWLWDKNNNSTTSIPSIYQNSGEIKKSALSTKENKTIAPSENEAEKNSITVVSQVAGNLVVVTEVRVAQPTWVAIHEDVNGVPSNILGAQLFDAGVYSGTVSLLRNTESERKYYAILYKDNGDRLFDYVTDLPLERASQDLVSASFMTVAESPQF